MSSRDIRTIVEAIGYLQRDPKDDPEYAETLANCTRDLATLNFSAAVARDIWQGEYERAVERVREARLYAAAYAHLAAKEENAT